MSDFLRVMMAVAACVGASAAQAQDVASFYKGKTVSVVIASAAGGGYDTYGRLVARHLGAQIPGNPTVIAQNMPGAAGATGVAGATGAAPAVLRHVPGGRGGSAHSIRATPGRMGTERRACGVAVCHPGRGIGQPAVSG